MEYNKKVNSSQIKYVTSNASTIKVTTFKLNH